MSRQTNKKLLSILRNGDAFDHADEQVMPASSGGKLMVIQPGKYNPPFKAQIQVQILKAYFTEALDIYTPILPAALAGALQVDLPFFTFLNSDFEAGYAKLKALFPVSGGWAYNPPVVYGKTVTPAAAFGAWDANVTAVLRDGDVVLPFTATTAGPVNTLGLVIIRTSDVPYASLLGATNSNTFKINMLRYTVNDGQEAQFANGILIVDETMFGKVTSDPVNPEAFKNPEQQQDFILDIDIETDINKQKGFASTADYDVLNIRWNLFIEKAFKIQ